jgi:hypothetical protein
MDALARGTSAERTAIGNTAAHSTAAYYAGYADGFTLLYSDRHEHAPPELLERVHLRYLSCVALEHPAPEALAYVAGFRDAAFDNLPCPPHEIESQDRRDAA